MANICGIRIELMCISEDNLMHLEDYLRREVNAEGNVLWLDHEHRPEYDFYHDSWGLFTTIFTSMMNDLRNKNVFSLLISVEEFITAFCSRILEAYREEAEYYASEQYFFDHCADLYDYDENGQLIPESVICSMEEWKGDLILCL